MAFASPRRARYSPKRDPSPRPPTPTREDLEATRGQRYGYGSVPFSESRVKKEKTYRGKVRESPKTSKDKLTPFQSWADHRTHDAIKTKCLNKSHQIVGASPKSASPRKSRSRTPKSRSKKSASKRSASTDAVSHQGSPYYDVSSPIVPVSHAHPARSPSPQLVAMSEQIPVLIRELEVLNAHLQTGQTVSSPNTLVSTQHLLANLLSGLNVSGGQPVQQPMVGETQARRSERAVSPGPSFTESVSLRDSDSEDLEAQALAEALSDDERAAAAYVSALEESQSSIQNTSFPYTSDAPPRSASRGKKGKPKSRTPQGSPAYAAPTFASSVKNRSKHASPPPGDDAPAPDAEAPRSRGRERVQRRRKSPGRAGDGRRSPATKRRSPSPSPSRAPRVDETYDEDGPRTKRRRSIDGNADDDLSESWGWDGAPIAPQPEAMFVAPTRNADGTLGGDWGYKVPIQSEPQEGGVSRADNNMSPTLAGTLTLQFTAPVGPVAGGTTPIQIPQAPTSSATVTFSSPEPAATSSPPSAASPSVPAQATSPAPSSASSKPKRTSPFSRTTRKKKQPSVSPVITRENEGGNASRGSPRAPPVPRTPPPRAPVPEVVPPQQVISATAPKAGVVRPQKREADRIQVRLEAAPANEAVAFEEVKVQDSSDAPIAVSVNAVTFATAQGGVHHSSTVNQVTHSELHAAGANHSQTHVTVDETVTVHTEFDEPPRRPHQGIKTPQQWVKDIYLADKKTVNVAAPPKDLREAEPELNFAEVPLSEDAAPISVVMNNNVYATDVAVPKTLGVPWLWKRPLHDPTAQDASLDSVSTPSEQSEISDGFEDLDDDDDDDERDFDAEIADDREGPAASAAAAVAAAYVSAHDSRAREQDDGSDIESLSASDALSDLSDDDNTRGIGISVQPGILSGTSPTGSNSSPQRIPPQAVRNILLSYQQFSRELARLEAQHSADGEILESFINQMQNNHN